MDVANINSRLKIATQPIAISQKITCFKTRIEQPIALRSEPKLESIILGYIDPGDIIGWFHEQEESWSFITVLYKNNNHKKVSGRSKDSASLPCLISDS